MPGLIVQPELRHARYPYGLSETAECPRDRYAERVQLTGNTLSEPRCQIQETPRA